MKINDQNVVSVRRVVWAPNDPAELRGVDRVMIIGRCSIELADGERVVAPLCAHTDQRRLGQTFALIYSLEAGAFVAIKVERDRDTMRPLVDEVSP